MRASPVATVPVVIAMLVALAAPIALSVYLADRHGREFTARRALDYARDVIHRTDSTADQAAAGIERLLAAHAPDPCGEPNLELMRRLHLAASNIQAFGYVAGDSIQCSSLGRLDKPLALGPPQFLTPKGVRLRTDVEFPFDKGTRYIGIEKDGYIAIVHKDSPIDATTREADVSLVSYMPGLKQANAARGEFDPAWIDTLGTSKEATFTDGRFVVGAVRSHRYATAAIAAVPVRYVEAQTRETALVMVPVGVAAGVLLALCVLHLARRQMAMPALLRAALKNKEFFLEYQPIVDLRDGRWVGAEALMRWHRPNGINVRPDLFIPVAEETGLIGQVTERVLELTGKDARNLFQRHPRFHIAINFSAADLHSDGLVDRLHRLAGQTGAMPGNLMAEMTERGFTDPEIAGKVVHRLRTAGVKVAIDDFGTGYSSLAHVQKLELDVLKIDKSFVDSLGTEAATNQVIFHIIEMAKALGLEMIAEGVQTPEQADALRERGVQYAQGYYFGKPMSFAELEARLNQPI